MVKDKINHRASGPRNNLTRQTVQGRANDGGLRIGEMERDAIICHGMTSFLKNSLIDRGDKFYMAICNNSGTIAIYNKIKNVFFSPYVDGPIKFDNIDSFINKNDKDTMLDENNSPLQNINDLNKISYTTKFGKEFSIVQIPFCLKLLMQELLTMNIQMRLITSDNINTLTNINNTSTTIPIDKILDVSAYKDLDDTIYTTKNDKDYGDPNDYDDTDDYESKIDDAGIYKDLDTSIIKHTSFNVGEKVYLINSDTKHPWIIENIDNSMDKQTKNITLFTVIDKDFNLPSGSSIKEIFDNTSNISYKYAVLKVNINDIIKFDEIIKYTPYVDDQIKKYTEQINSNDLENIQIQKNEPVVNTVSDVAPPTIDDPDLVEETNTNDPNNKNNKIVKIDLKI
jgi:hypothetical protein